MLKIDNLSATPQRFTQADGTRIAVAPGESGRVNLAPDNIRVDAKKRAGLIAVEAVPASRKKAAPPPSDGKTDANIDDGGDDGGVAPPEA